MAIHEKLNLGAKDGSVAELVFSTYRALGSIASTRKGEERTHFKNGIILKV